MSDLTKVIVLDRQLHTVVEIIECPEETSLNLIQHPNIFEYVDGVELGWTYTDGTFHSPVVDHDELKNIKCTMVDNERIRLEALGVSLDFGPSFDVVQTRNETDKSNIQLALTMVNSDLVQGIENKTYVFRAESNVEYTLTAAQMLTLGSMVLGHIQSLLKTAQDYKEVIRNLPANTTAEEIIALPDWPV